MVVCNQPAQPDVEILLRRSRRIRRPALSGDYLCLYESDINIGHSNDPNSFDEAVYSWLIEMQEELNSIHDNDVEPCRYSG